MTTRTVTLAIVLTVAASGASLDAGQNPAAEQRVAELKLALQENQAQLRTYEWIETTIIHLKGEEKARKLQRCYYGADGKIQKIPIGNAAPPQPATTGGRRGGRVKAAIIENKKDDMREYMERAAALVHRYVPPAPLQIQQVRDAGHLQVTPLDPGRARLSFTDYLQPGDALTIDLNVATATLALVSVATYLDKADDAVQLEVRFGVLADGTGYPARITLDAKAKNIRVVIENSGYKPLVP